MLRLAKEKEIYKILEIYNDIIDYEKNNIIYTGWEKDEYPNLSTIKNAIINNEMYVYEDDVIYGSVILNSKMPKEYNNIKWKVQASQKEVLIIHTLSIDPKFKNQGLGKYMIQLILEFAKTNNYKTIRLETSENNVPAYRLYEKMGFEYIEKIDIVYGKIVYHNMKCYEIKIQ